MPNDDAASETSLETALAVLAKELEAQARSASLDITVARALMAQCEELIKLSYDKIVSADALLAQILAAEEEVTIRDDTCSVEIDEIDW